MRAALIAAVTALVGSAGTFAVADQGSDDATSPAAGVTTERAQPPAATRAPARDRAPVPARRAAATDVSGPCDEAEHANDPRCTGAGAAQDRDDDDRRNRGSGNDDDDRSGSSSGGDDDGDDRSGSNSGKG